MMTSVRGSMNHLRLTVTDVKRAKAFYGPLLAHLGYQISEEDDGRIGWGGGGPGGGRQWIIISGTNEQTLHSSHDMFSPGLHHFAFNVDSRAEVDGFYELLLKQHAEIQDPPKEYDYEPGYYAVFFKDPDGIKLEVVNVPVPW